MKDTKYIYITPPGWICTCGESAHTLTGAEASRKALVHSVKHNDWQIIDLRKGQ